MLSSYSEHWAVSPFKEDFWKTDSKFVCCCENEPEKTAWNLFAQIPNKKLSGSKLTKIYQYELTEPWD